MCAPSSAAARLPQYNVQLLFPNALFRFYHQIPCAEAEILTKEKKIEVDMSRISRDFHTANQNRHGFRFFGFILETFATIYSSVTGYILVNRFFHLSPLRDTSQSPA
jgi:hypothetical protein